LKSEPRIAETPRHIATNAAALLGFEHIESEALEELFAAIARAA